MHTRTHTRPHVHCSLDLRWTYAGPTLLDLCWSYAGLMYCSLDLRWTYAGPMLDSYWANAGFVLVSCRAHDIRFFSDETCVGEVGRRRSTQANCSMRSRNAADTILPAAAAQGSSSQLSNINSWLFGMEVLGRSSNVKRMPPDCCSEPHNCGFSPCAMRRTAPMAPARTVPRCAASHSNRGANTIIRRNHQGRARVSTRIRRAGGANGTAEDSGTPTTHCSRAGSRIRRAGDSLTAATHCSRRQF